MQTANPNPRSFDIHGFPVLNSRGPIVNRLGKPANSEGRNGMRIGQVSHDVLCEIRGTSSYSWERDTFHNARRRDSRDRYEGLPGEKR